jgi:hypothetical protein
VSFSLLRFSCGRRGSVSLLSGPSTVMVPLYDGHMLQVLPPKKVPASQHTCNTAPHLSACLPAMCRCTTQHGRLPKHLPAAHHPAAGP